jgi:hypothetical protein
MVYLLNQIKKAKSLAELYPSVCHQELLKIRMSILSTSLKSWTFLGVPLFDILFKSIMKIGQC